MPRKKKILTEEKNKGLFDHINHIRRDKSADYYSSLNETEKKSFNHYMIVRCLSMDKSIIEEIAYISKYFDKIPSELFYKLCCEITPRSTAFFPYIKNKKKKYEDKLIEYVMKRYEISSKEAHSYCDLFFVLPDGTERLLEICKGYGLTDKEAKKLLTS